MHSSREIIVSVIIPFYNNQDTIQRCLKSIESQSHKCYEIILVNDASTDRSLDRIRNYGYNAVSLETNSGSAAARNVGLKLVTGDLVTFLDADDYWEESFLERVVEVFLKFSDVDVVSTAQKIMYDGNLISYNPVLAMHTGTWKAIDFWGFWAENDFLMTGSVVFRKKMIKIVGYQNVNLRVSQDLEYWSRLGSKAKNWIFINEALFVTDGLVGVKGRKWYRKYKARRKGIAPMGDLVKGMSLEVPSNHFDNFNQVVSRLAANYFLIQLLGGHIKEAERTFKLYNPILLGSPGLTKVVAVFAHNRFGLAFLSLFYRFYDFIKNVVIKK